MNDPKYNYIVVGRSRNRDRVNESSRRYATLASLCIALRTTNMMGMALSSVLMRNLIQSK